MPLYLTNKIVLGLCPTDYLPLDKPNIAIPDDSVSESLQGKWPHEVAVTLSRNMSYNLIELLKL